MGTGRGLFERMVLRRGKVRPFMEQLVGVAVEPVFTGLIRANPLMVLLASMPARVLSGRSIAATDVAALRTPTQMEPPTAAGLAFHTSGPARRNFRVDPWHKAHRRPP